jgi:hypothetical protein
LIARHVVVACIFCLVMPALSWLDGSGWLAWTMFSKSETFRLDVEVEEGAGRRRVVNPNELAPFAAADLAAFLGGAESWRHAPVGAGFQRSLPGLAQLACRLSPPPRFAHVRLERRAHLDAPVQVTQAQRSCPP